MLGKGRRIEKKKKEVRKVEDRKKTKKIVIEGLFFRILEIGALSWDMEKEGGCRGSPLWLRASRSEEETGKGEFRGHSAENRSASSPQQTGDQRPSHLSGPDTLAQNW